MWLCLWKKALIFILIWKKGKKEGRRKLRIKIRFRKSSLRQNKHSLEMPKFTFHYIWNMIVIFVDRLSHCKPCSSNESVVCSQWCHKVSCVIGIQDRKHFDSPGCWTTWSLLYHGWVNRLIDLLNHLPQRRKKKIRCTSICKQRREHKEENWWLQYIGSEEAKEKLLN